MLSSIKMQDSHKTFAGGCTSLIKVEVVALMEQMGVGVWQIVLFRQDLGTVKQMYLLERENREVFYPLSFLNLALDSPNCAASGS